MLRSRGTLRAARTATQAAESRKCGINHVICLTITRPFRYSPSGKVTVIG